MQWIHQYQLFLFDFDGLLVNTEHLHYQAYVNMLEKRGFRLEWNFAQFCSLAHLNATALKEGFYTEFPGLDPNWTMLYEEKKAIYQELLLSGKVELMEGVEQLLCELAAAGIRRCVVTNSLYDQICLIRSQHAVLQTIPHWITREDYEKPKPDPEGYLRAIAIHGRTGDQVIGFEDSVRGLQALSQTSAQPVLICSSHHPLLNMVTEGTALHFQSFTEIPDDLFLYRS